MAEPNIVKEAVEQTLTLIDDVTEKVRESLGYHLGMEQVSERLVAGLTRKSVRDLDMQAFAQLTNLYGQQVAVPNPMDAVILRVLEEEAADAKVKS